MSCQALKAVVFDLDGLMFNTEDIYDQVGNALLEPHGFQFTPELKDAMTGRPAPIALQIMIDHHKLDATVDQLRAATDAMFPEMLQRLLAPMPDLFTLLEALEGGGIAKAIATSSRRDYVRRILSAFALEPRFQFVLTAESVTEGKPHPEIYIAAAAEFGIRPPEMMVLEDSEIGCRAAVAAGAVTVAVPGPHSRHHDFGGARLVADGLGDRRILRLLGLDNP